ncbi:uncharacterized protein LOC130052437 isoform X2 [Ostrea edulis]|uniref:uncharacterized protein LOC130052437 isoform X2 n=1 Tax=Ostrea edulis TaxID=37623 RepID=UPI0024AF4219|nr:uncharacterized protein LOC130052437 isoform X2 [Ostrea edulis]
MDIGASYAECKEELKSESDHERFILSLPVPWRKYAFPKEHHRRQSQSIRKFLSILSGYQKAEEQLDEAIRRRATDSEVRYVYDLDDVDYDEYVEQFGKADIPHLQTAEFYGYLECLLMQCYAKKKWLIDKSEELASINGKPPSISLKGWLTLPPDVRLSMSRRESAKTIELMVEIIYELKTENMRMLEENEKLKLKNVEIQKLLEENEKLKLRSIEIQKDRAAKEEVIHYFKMKMAENERTIKDLTKKNSDCRNQLHLNSIADLQQKLAHEKKSAAEAIQYYKMKMDENERNKIAPKSVQLGKDEFQRMLEENEKLKEKNVLIQKDRAAKEEAIHYFKKKMVDNERTIKDLTKVNSDCRNQLHINSIADLQQKLAHEKKSVDELRQHRDTLKKDKEHLLIRLTEVAGAKLTTNIPAITNLGDENRPLKLSEKFSQLYDDEWCDSFEEILSNGLDEVYSIAFLLRVVMSAFHLCSRSTSMFINVRDCKTLLWCEGGMEMKLVQRLDLTEEEKIALEGVTRDLRYSRKDIFIDVLKKKFLVIMKGMILNITRKRKSNQISPEELQTGNFSMPTHASYVAEEFLLKREEIEELFSVPMEYEISEEAMSGFVKTLQFAERCVELCWLMQAGQPPMYLDADIPENRQFETEILKVFTKKGNVIDYIVWPVLYLHKNGPLLSKGVAQPR